jgi:uncharacterized protein (DUF1015 family)
VACPPYDVINTAEARALAQGNADSFLHVTRPEIDLPEGTDEHADEVYTRAVENFRALVERGVLVQEARPALYVYAQEMGGHRQVGLVGCTSVAEYDRDVIKKHEKTRQDKEDDRTRHIDTLGAHDEPVFLTYRAVAAIDALVERVMSAAPVYDFKTHDYVEVRHALWVVPEAETAELVRLFGGVEALFVADGHHRSAAASRVHQQRRGQSGEHDAFLAVLFPHNQMQIQAYNRVVRDVKGRSPEQLLALFKERFDVSEAAAPAPTAARSFGLFLGGRWYTLQVRAGTVQESDPVASLDCSICQDQILAPLFGIQDPRTDKNVDFVGGIRGSGELEKRVREGWTLALHLFPTSIEQLMSVSNAGLLMPPKSTWFEPKLRSGLFIHAF